MIERAGQSCAIGSALFERIHQPYAREGQRTGAFRFGDTRAMALAGALHHVLNAYRITPEGIRVAVFYTKLQNRLLRPLLDADQPPARLEIRNALATLERAVKGYINTARLAPAT